MSRFASRGLVLEDLIHAWTLQVPALRGVALVDENGLVLVSTLQARGLEEGLSAFAATAAATLERARSDIGVGATVFLHLAGRDRQLLLVPVQRDISLLAFTDPAVTASSLVPHLLALARELAELGQGGA